MCYLWNKDISHSLHFFYVYKTALRCNVKYITHTFLKNKLVAPGCRSPPADLKFKFQIDWRKHKWMESIQSEKRINITPMI